MLVYHYRNASKGYICILKSELQINIYHCSSNLVIVWIEFYFPEEIMDIVLRRADSLWQKDMEMVDKILRRKKKTKHHDLVRRVLLCPFLQ